MKEARRRLADALYANSKEHDESRSDRFERFRNVEPPTAELLGVLIRATGARRILELGTSNGYSTIWLADAAQDTGGMVVSVDADAGRTELARQNQPSNAVGEPDHARMLLVPVRVGGATVNVRQHRSLLDDDTGTGGCSTPAGETASSAGSSRHRTLYYP